MAARSLQSFRLNIPKFLQAFSHISHCGCQSGLLRGSGIGTYNVAKRPVQRRIGYLSYRVHQILSNGQFIVGVSERNLATKASKKQTVKKVAGKKPEIKQGPGVMYHELPIMYVNANYNNTMFTITDHNGLIAAWTSAGVEGFKGAKRGTNYAGQMAAVAAAKKAKTLGIETLRVKIKGMGPGRHSSIKGLAASGIGIVSITDVTPVPHNGCKPPKQRRI